MLSRIPKEANLQKDHVLKKKGRGSYYQTIREDGKICLVKWFDTRPVHLASSIFEAQPEKECKRWSKTDQKYIEIKQPDLIKKYNSYMGGVDLLDRVIGMYAMRSRTNKWTIRAIYHFVDFAVAAAWLEYKNDAEMSNLPKKEILDDMNFKISIAKYLLIKDPENREDEESNNNTEEEAESSKKLRSVEPIPDKRFRKQMLCIFQNICTKNKRIDQSAGIQDVEN